MAKYDTINKYDTPYLDFYKPNKACGKDDVDGGEEDVPCGQLYPRCLHT